MNIWWLLLARVITFTPPYISILLHIYWWRCAYSTSLEILNVSQRYIRKIIIGKQRNHPSDLLHLESGLLNIPQLLIISTFKTCYNNPKYRKPLLHTINFGPLSKGKIFIPKRRIKQCHMNIEFVVTKLYNDG